MAQIKYVNKAGQYHDDQARNQLICYIINPYKAKSNCIGGSHIDMSNPAEDMKQVALKYNKDNGIRIHHFVITFLRYEVSSPQMANRIAQDICTQIGRIYPVIYGVHKDTGQLHIHMAFNAVSHVNGYKFRANNEDKDMVVKICREVMRWYGIQKVYLVK